MSFIENYSKYKEGKFVVAERFIKKYINKLDKIVSKYNNKYHRTRKLDPIDAKTSTYTDSSGAKQKWIFFPATLYQKLFF